MRKDVWSLLGRACCVERHFPKASSALRSVFQAPAMGRIVYQQKVSYCEEKQIV